MTGIWDQFVGFFATAIRTLADLFSFAGGYRWALAIVGLTVITRALLLPLAVKQIKSMRETQRLQPEIQRLRQKYKNDRQKQMAEMQELYQREGVNPYASCLPMIAQAPVFMATYFAIRDLKDAIGDFRFLGAQLDAQAYKTAIGIALIAIMTLAQLLTTRQLNPGQTEQQKKMQLLMPVMFIFLFYSFPVALVLYWTTSNVFQLVFQLVMTRDMRPPGSGWRGLLGIGLDDKSKGKGKGGKGAKGGKNNGQRNGKPAARVEAPVPQRAKEKAQVSAPVSSGPEPVASYDPLASRRTIDEKRARRRRKKKKRKRS